VQKLFDGHTCKSEGTIFFMRSGQYKRTSNAIILLFMIFSVERVGTCINLSLLFVVTAGTNLDHEYIFQEVKLTEAEEKDFRC
jgi:hypothetical protein